MMSNTPEVRFAGFSEDWKKREFKSTFTILQNNTLSRAELVDDCGAAQNVHYGDVLVRFGEVLDLETEELPYIESAQIAEKYKSSYLHNGDVIVADTAEDEAAGKCTEILGVGDVPVVSGLHTIPLRPQQDFATGYLGYYLNSDVYHHSLLPLLQGTKVLSISKTALQGTSICYPNDYQEQAQIGDCFRKLDKLIILQQRKYEKLVALKAACLDKMFPKNGSKVPEVRFAGFSGDWKLRKLNDEASEIVAGGDVDKSLLTENGKYPVIANALTNDGVVGYYAEEYRIKAPAVTVTGRGDVGHAKARQVDFTPVVRLLSIRTKHDVLFLENAINTLSIIIESTGVPQLTVPQLARYKLFFPPTVDEEKAIGNFLVNLDTLITLHQCKLVKLKQVKQAMLHDMFV